jgi:predicted MPP superfamily phosphohydrolase
VPVRAEICASKNGKSNASALTLPKGKKGRSRSSSTPQILAGDIFCGDDAASLRSDLTWIKSLGFKNTLAVLGNHDLVLTHLLKTQPETARGLLVSVEVMLLRDSDTVINGLKFYGVDWRSQAEIPTGNDVVVSHCPAMGLVDQRYPPDSEHLGDGWLAKRIEAVKPRLVVSGHFHGGHGRAERHGTTFVNCSLANEARELANKPQVVDLEPR